MEQGEHGYLAARAAAQVIKAYVEKQRARQLQQQQHVAEVRPVARLEANPKDVVIPSAARNRLSNEKRGTRNQKLQFLGFWSSPDPHDGNKAMLKSARFQLLLDRVPKPPAVAMAGLQP